MSSPTEFIAEPDVVILDLAADSGEAAVQALHARLVERGDAVTNPPVFLAELIARMQVAPVCIANDVALPHARTNAVSRMVLAVARTERPIPFDPDHPAVRIIFLIGTPKDDVGEYLQALEVLSRLLRNGTTRRGLLAAADAAEFRALLSGGVTAHR